MLNEKIRPVGLAHLTLIYQCLKDLPFEVLKNIAFEIMSNNCNKSNSTIQNLVWLPLENLRDISLLT